MAVQPAHCRLCGEPHWSHQPHKFPKDMKVRKMVQQFTGKVIEGTARFIEPVTAVAVVEKPVTARKPRTKTADKTCDCGTIITKPERGPWPRFCSDTCRKRASRKKA